MHGATVEVVRLVGEVLGTGIVEQLEGLPIDAWLALRARMVGCDRATLLTAADVLRHMPICWSAFVDGQLSWGLVRHLATRLGKRSRADRYTIDARIGATCATWDGLDVYDPDRLRAVIDRAIWDLDPVADRERAEDDSESASFVAIQPSFDGRVTGGFDLDPVAGATLLNGLDAATPDGPVKTRPQRRVAGLVTLAETFLAGSRPGAAKPTVVVTVDLASITPTSAGVLDLQVPGGIAPVLTARTIDALAADADLRAVVCDGYRPLTVTRKRTAADLPADIRTAVLARDVVDRFPGSDRPITHVHHTRPRGTGGDHHIDGLIGLSDRSHGIVHDHGWACRHDPDTGVFTITRHGVTWRSIPQTTPLQPAPPGDPP